MTPADAARILAVAALYDRRTVGETDALAWADALQGLDPRECAEAVREWYRDSDQWLMPAHVREIIARRQHDAAERRKNERQLAAIEGAKRERSSTAQARDECMKAYADAIATAQAKRETTS